MSRKSKHLINGGTHIQIVAEVAEWPKGGCTLGQSEWKDYTWVNWRDGVEA